MEIGLATVVPKRGPSWFKPESAACFDGGGQMSDIIKDAKQLLDGATPAPWEVDIDGLEVYSTVDGDAVAHAQTPSDADLIAAAPELAQALDEETYEYSIQLKDHTGEWETATNSETHLEEWWEDLKYAEWAKEEEQEHGYSCRVVRRRVSPPEVVNE